MSDFEFLAVTLAATGIAWFTRNKVLAFLSAVFWLKVGFDHIGNTPPNWWVAIPSVCFGLYLAFEGVLSWRRGD